MADTSNNLFERGVDVGVFFRVLQARIRMNITSATEHLHAKNHALVRDILNDGSGRTWDYLWIKVENAHEFILEIINENGMFADFSFIDKERARDTCFAIPFDEVEPYASPYD